MIEGGGETGRPFGPALIYEPVRKLFENKLDEISASEQTKWVHETVLPLYERNNVAPAELGANLKTYVQALAGCHWSRKSNISTG